MKLRIHINQHVVAANRKHGRRDPVFTVKSYKSNHKVNALALIDCQGSAIARLCYSETAMPDPRLGCIWVELVGGEYLQVSKAQVKANDASGDYRHSPIELLSAGQVQYPHCYGFRDAVGHVLGQIVYRPQSPLPCGAKAWIEIDDCYVRLPEKSKATDKAIMSTPMDSLPLFAGTPL